MVKLLDTLPEEYESLRQAWWARPDDQQTFKNLVALLTSDEKRRQHQNRKQNGLALAAAQAKSQIKGEREDGTSGGRCQQKSTSENTKTRKKRIFKCYGCGGTGHIHRNCPSAKSSKKATDIKQAYVSEVLGAEYNDKSWIVDTGATDYITNDNTWFTTFEHFVTPVKIKVGDQSTMEALGKGTIKFEAAVDGRWVKECMYDVLYAELELKQKAVKSSAVLVLRESSIAIPLSSDSSALRNLES
ncbi:uncharacterized protein [Temnothorax longispinosus]|uniref:uncharacterized protein n=1 Tax=Temnothorax longispinosus TaxID=300112 RepID=UPI003A9A0F5E